MYFIYNSAKVLRTFKKCEKFLIRLKISEGLSKGTNNQNKVHSKGLTSLMAYLKLDICCSNLSKHPNKVFPQWELNMGPLVPEVGF